MTLRGVGDEASQGKAFLPVTDLEALCPATSPWAAPQFSKPGGREKSPQRAGNKGAPSSSFRGLNGGQVRPPK